MQSLGVPDDARVLVGVSGGADSMVLLHAFHALKYKITAAHVNFKLRGEESDQDAEYVRNWCHANQIPFLLLEADTKKYAEDNNLNTQQAARQIRYTWWEDLKGSNSIDYVATAHHLDDNIETFFVNLLRGTGIKGLSGIPAERDGFIRPMLEVSRHEIEEYASAFQIAYRIDSSNLKDDYQRNKIRHHLVPLLEELSPGFSSRMQHNLVRAKKEWEDFDRSFHSWVRSNIHVEKHGFQILDNKEYPAFLLKWLEEEGMPWNLSLDFISSGKENEGKVLHYQDLTLSRTGKGYFFQKENKREIIEINSPGTYEFYNGILTIQELSEIPATWPRGSSTEFVSPSVMQFPLHIRHVEPGDAFQPLGMNGHHKKLQDLLVDRKLEMHEKHNVRVLANQHHIIWVVGIHLDERAKVTKGDPFVYKLEWKED